MLQFLHYIPNYIRQEFPLVQQAPVLRTTRCEPEFGHELIIRTVPEGCLYADEAHRYRHDPRYRDARFYNRPKPEVYVCRRSFNGMIELPDLPLAVHEVYNFVLCRDGCVYEVGSHMDVAVLLSLDDFRPSEFFDSG
jgi:hypothetical protein